MIRIRKSLAPPGYVAHQKKWDAGFARKRPQKTGESATKSWVRIRTQKAFRSYTTILKKDFRGKCAYCESKMEHVSPAHIEHFYPKSVFHDRIFLWKNLLLACHNCNASKINKFPQLPNGKPVLINPCVDEPEHHISFQHAHIISLTDRGRITIEIVALERTALQEERARWLIYVEILMLLCSDKATRAAAANF